MRTKRGYPVRTFNIAEFDRRSHQAIPQTRTLLPFPGRWPTRIVWQLKIRQHGVSYIGKPTVEAVSRFQTLVLIPNALLAHSYLIEFDRTGVPIYRWSNWGMAEVNAVPFSLYHYWQGYAAYGAHLSIRTFSQRIRGFPVYSPYRTLSAERQQDWLNFVHAQVPELVKRLDV